MTLEHGYQTLFQRCAKNPILSAADWPYPAHSVFNPGAIRLPDTTTLLLCRVEDRRGHSHLCAARSSDGITQWQRHPANPIVRPGENQWDHDACYKPCAIFDGQKWLLWYNGRHGDLEQIGVALHAGEDLGF